MEIRQKIKFIYLLTLIGITLWMGLILLAPYLQSRFPGMAKFIYAVFAPTCHQIPSRCLYIFGYPMAVCARCFGIYSGFLLGTMFFPLIKGFSAPSLPPAKAIIAVSVPMVIDAAGNFLGVWASSNPVRLATGVLWGIALPFYFIAGISDYILRQNQS
jgi:uncharacterized membrane protein